MILTRLSVVNESGVDCDTGALERLTAFLYEQLRLHPECELGITLVDSERMSTLHEDWMHEPGPTDVLSFPIDEVRAGAPGVDPVPGILGDIVLCPEFAQTQALSEGRCLDDELQFLVVHGTLHLLGHDHATQEEYDRMFGMQDRLLDGWRNHER